MFREHAYAIGERMERRDEEDSGMLRAGTIMPRSASPAYGNPARHPCSTSFHVAVLALSRLRSAFLVHSTTFHNMFGNVENHRRPGLIMTEKSFIWDFT